MRAGRRACVRAGVVACVAISAASGCDRKASPDGAATQGAAFRPLGTGDAVPEFRVAGLAGDSLRVGPGQPLTVVNIWATWCIPCQKEFGDLERIHRAFEPKGVRMLAISVDKGADGPVQAFIQEKGATFTIGRDSDASVQRLLRGYGVPETYLIGSDGKLLWKVVGALRDGGSDLEQAIQSNLAS